MVKPRKIFRQGSARDRAADSPHIHLDRQRALQEWVGFLVLALGDVELLGVDDLSSSGQRRQRRSGGRVLEVQLENLALETPDQPAAMKVKSSICLDSEAPTVTLVSFSPYFS